MRTPPCSYTSQSALLLPTPSLAFVVREFCSAQWFVFGSQNCLAFHRPALSPPRLSQPRRKRFDKRQAERFVLVHRSRDDPSYGVEGASDMVLLNTKDHTVSAAAGPM